MRQQVQPLTPAALYARVSSDRQDVDLSVAAQLRALRDFAKNNGYSIAREYVDEAESGRIADRPQFRQMIEEGGKATAPFQVILVCKFSRFTRKREHAVAFKSMLRRKGIRVVSITEHADDSPTGKLDFTHFKRHKRGNLQYDGTEWRGVSVHRSWRSIVKNPPTPTTSGYAQR